MLRIELEAEDLGRIRFADAPAPAVETSLMLLELRRRPHLIHGRSSGTGDDWRRSAHAAFTSTARALLPLAPTARHVFFLDMFTADPHEAFDRVHDLPVEVTQAFAKRLPAELGPVSEWTRRFDEGDPVARAETARALRSFHAACLAPRWSEVTAAFHRDQFARISLMRRHGVAAMLNTLSPDLHLNGLTLEGRHPWERRVRLGGRGLLLIPSAFWTEYPFIVRYDGEYDEGSARHALIYPARHDPAHDTRGGYSRTGMSQFDPLAMLLGHTRAVILRALRHPYSTSTLARHAGVSPAAASTHAGTLRAAGLITSERHGQTVVHQLTELGSALLWQQF